MKIKVTLRRDGVPDRDLVVTADAATTVGDLGRHLRLADPDHAPTPAEAQQEMTVGLVRDRVRPLDPRTPLAESPLRSGATVAVLPVGAPVAGGPTGDLADAVAVATVVEGPDAGTEFPLRSGTNIVGRQRACEVRLNDQMVSRTHARLNVTDHVEVIDLGSANGVELNGSLVNRQVVAAADRIKVGDTVLTVRITRSVAPQAVSESTTVGFIRSPRLAPQFAGQEFEVPELPQRQELQPFPMLMLVFPILMAGVMYLVTRQLTTVIFTGLMPLMMISSWWEQRHRAGKATKAALAGFRADVANLVAEADELAAQEVADRQGEHPAAEQCLVAAAQRSPLLWTRRPKDWGFLELRAGLGTCPSRSSVKLPTGKNGIREMLAEAREATAHLAHVAPVPVVIRPSQTGGMGVAGPRSAAVAAVRALVVQAAALHSPADLAITLVTGSRSGQDWQWLKWLPHVDSPWTPVEAAHLASTPGGAAALVTALETLVAQRAQEQHPEQVPAVLLVVESEAPVEFGRLVDLAETGWPVGVQILWVAPVVEQLPAACRTFLETSTAEQSAVGYVHDASLVTPVATESVTADEALAFARSLAPVVDLGARNEDVSDLPRSIPFLAMDGYEALGDQPDAVIERWNQNHSILTGPRAGEPVHRESSLRAAVGQSAGHLHHVDLRSDGPHALVGGTTGAGKSELLQSWILSMAANYSPQRLTFLLVDYKGGSAFADCVKLPHTVGMVTDLNPNGVQRALRSLAAELRYREHVLGQAKAKDLMALEKRGAVDAPPSLVIVVDEFAALVQEVPEFVDGVVNVAQRGRSLGLHLILATQRPAGVIKDNLRANTNLRMALRVADEADSTDVLGSPEAAFFDPDLPGRAVSKTGPGRLVPFQTAYAGGHTGSGPAAPDIQVRALTLDAGLGWEIPEPLLPPRPAPGGASDIARVVHSIQGATVLAQLADPRKPWLPDLPGRVDVLTLEQPLDRPGQLAFGLVDLPDEQDQAPVVFDPDKEGNLAIFGASGAGKSTAMRTLAAVAGLSFGYGPTWVYGLDFGSGGLGMLESLPTVGDVIPGTDDERVRRLLRWLAGVIDDRTNRYKTVNADSVTDYRQLSGQADEPRILVLLDGVGAFLKAYESEPGWVDRLVDIAAKGRPLGVHFVVAADRAGALPTQLAATIQRRLVLRMTTSDDYDNLAVPRAVLSPDSPPGRGIWGTAEVQVAVLGSAADLGGQAAELARAGAWMVEQGAPQAPGIPRLPETLPLETLPAALGEQVVIGIGDATMGPLGVLPEGTFVVMGPPASGRTTALRTLTRAVLRARSNAHAYLFTLDRRSPLLREDLWTGRALGVDDGQLLADQLAAELAGDLVGPVVIVVDRVSEWSGSMAETALEALIKAAVRAGAFVISDGEANAFSRSFGLEAAANASRVGFALQPDSGDGAGFGVRLPLRLNKADFPPGRGFLFRAGRAELGHLALVRADSRSE